MANIWPNFDQAISERSKYAAIATDHMRLKLPSPREWQLEAIESWTNNHYKGIVKVVTGGGKTVFSGYCLSEIFKFSPDSNVLIIVPTIVLRDQWFSILVHSWGVEQEEVSTELVDGNSKKFTIIVVNTAAKRELSRWFNDKSVLIVDECHKTASEVFRRIYDYGFWKYTLGLSATPERQYDTFFEDILIPSLGEIVFNYDYVRADDDKVIAPFTLTHHKVPFTQRESEKYDDFTKKIAIEHAKLKMNGEQNSERLKSLYMRRSTVSKRAEFRAPIAAKLIKNLIPKKIILFHESIDEIEALNAYLVSLGIDSKTYHSRLTPKSKLLALRQFIRSEIDVLLTCRALDEGFDLPDIEVGIFAAMTKSPRQRIQRLGRILRPLDGKKADIRTLYTLHEEGFLLNESESLNEICQVKWMGSE